jgi:hypothetical protein
MAGFGISTTLGSLWLCGVSWGSLRRMLMPWCTRSRGLSGRGWTPWLQVALGRVMQAGQPMMWKLFGSIW